MILRCTAKILTLLGARPAELAMPPASDDDWYLNLLWIDRRKCLLLTHAGALFPAFVADVRKAKLRPIGPYVVSLAEENLSAEGLAPDALGRLEVLCRTASRRTPRAPLDERRPCRRSDPCRAQQDEPRRDRRAEEPRWPT